MYCALFASLKASGLYPDLLDRKDDEKEDEARKRQEKEESRIRSLSCKELENDYNKKYNIVIESRDKSIKEVEERKLTVETLKANMAVAEQRRRHCVENHSSDNIILECKRDVEAIDKSIRECNEESERHSSELDKCDAVLSHCHQEVDPKVFALSLMSDEQNVPGSCRNYIMIRSALDCKRVEYNGLDDSIKMSASRKQLTSAVSEARIVTTPSADDNNNVKRPVKGAVGKGKLSGNSDSNESETASSSSEESGDSSESSNSSGSDGSAASSHESEGSGQSSSAGKDKSTKRSKEKEKSKKTDWATSRAERGKTPPMEESSSRRRRSSKK